jgi:hypothetical protein
VRIIYLDENGIGNIENDPDHVVAGILVHGDRQWIPLKNHLLSLLRSYVPQGAPTPIELSTRSQIHRIPPLST